MTHAIDNGLLAIEACVREYHVYQDIWEATISEEFLCERQPMNPSDRYAVAVKKDGMVVGFCLKNLCQSTFRIWEATLFLTGAKVPKKSHLYNR